MRGISDLGLKPSQELQEEYEQDQGTLKLTLPEYSVLRDKIGMDYEVYQKLKETYDQQELFKYHASTSVRLVRSRTGETNGIQGWYVGQFKAHSNTPHGIGILVWANGLLRQGYCQDNFWEYFGREIMNGNVYEGGYARSARKGFGKETTNEGEIYIGMFKDSLRHGRGEVLYANGDRMIREYYGISFLWL
eukprot:CAMPEP_0168326324 /NCGR_PEP_ID=MMETSP0213-20121227/5231_1 /TAXON_ID=151035 /ORGANISM="Euplotes harpa, Strain FSP1.4" /LENGTH=190 /DNA_ID=CAMNT_0008329009 /DNA_START=418 /DNA_END=990 /DNA_ORIENTATION=-